MSVHDRTSASGHRNRSVLPSIASRQVEKTTTDQHHHRPQKAYPPDLQQQQQQQPQQQQQYNSSSVVRYAFNGPIYQWQGNGGHDSPDRMRCAVKSGGDSQANITASPAVNNDISPPSMQRHAYADRTQHKNDPQFIGDTSRWHSIHSSSGSSRHRHHQPCLSSVGQPRTLAPWSCVTFHPYRAISAPESVLHHPYMTRQLCTTLSDATMSDSSILPAADCAGFDEKTYRGDSPHRALPSSNGLAQLLSEEEKYPEVIHEPSSIARSTRSEASGRTSALAQQPKHTQQQHQPASGSMDDRYTMDTNPRDMNTIPSPATPTMTVRDNTNNNGVVVVPPQFQPQLQQRAGIGIGMGGVNNHIHNNNNNNIDNNNSNTANQYFPQVVNTMMPMHHTVHHVTSNSRHQHHWPGVTEKSHLPLFPALANFADEHCRPLLMSSASMDSQDQSSPIMVSPNHYSQAAPPLVNWPRGGGSQPPSPSSSGSNSTHSSKNNNNIFRRRRSLSTPAELYHATPRRTLTTSPATASSSNYHDNHNNNSNSIGKLIGKRLHSKRGRKQIALTEDDIRMYLHLPQADAAKALGVSTSTLKRRYKELKRGRWPTSAALATSTAATSSKIGREVSEFQNVTGGADVSRRTVLVGGGDEEGEFQTIFDRRSGSPDESSTTTASSSSTASSTISSCTQSNPPSPSPTPTSLVSADTSWTDLQHDHLSVMEEEEEACAEQDHYHHHHHLRYEHSGIVMTEDVDNEYTLERRRRFLEHDTEMTDGRLAGRTAEEDSPSAQTQAQTAGRDILIPSTQHVHAPRSLSILLNEQNAPDEKMVDQSTLEALRIAFSQTHNV